MNKGFDIKKIGKMSKALSGFREATGHDPIDFATFLGL